MAGRLARGPSSGGTSVIELRAAVLMGERVGRRSGGVSAGVGRRRGPLGTLRLVATSCFLLRRRGHVRAAPSRRPGRRRLLLWCPRPYACGYPPVVFTEKYLGRVGWTRGCEPVTASNVSAIASDWVGFRQPPPRLPCRQACPRRLPSCQPGTCATLQRLASS